MFTLPNYLPPMPLNLYIFFAFQISSTATMVPRGSHRVVPNLTNVGASIVSDTSMSSTITRITNSFQVNGVGPPKKGAGPPPCPPNKPTVSALIDRSTKAFKMVLRLVLKGHYLFTGKLIIGVTQLLA